MVSTDAEHDALWQGILAQVPKYAIAVGADDIAVSPAFHAPVRIGNKVYALRPDKHANGRYVGCAACIAKYGSKEPRRPDCAEMPGCEDGYYAEFTPEDYTILVARGDTITGDPHHDQ